MAANIPRNAAPLGARSFSSRLISDSFKLRFSRFPPRPIDAVASSISVFPEIAAANIGDVFLKIFSSLRPAMPLEF